MLRNLGNTVYPTESHCASTISMGSLISGTIPGPGGATISELKHEFILHRFFNDYRSDIPKR